MYKNLKNIIAFLLATLGVLTLSTQEAFSHHKSFIPIQNKSYGNILSDDGKCLTTGEISSTKKSTVWLETCIPGSQSRGGNQKWTYDEPTGSLRNLITNQCLDINPETKEVILNQCNGTSQQDWHRDNDDQNDFITNDTGGCLERLLSSEKSPLKLGVCEVNNSNQQFYIQH
jgi:hypothetical protein